MRGAHHHDAPHAAGDESLASILEQVAGELRGVRQALQQQAGNRGLHH
jgi:hypothetical protein